MKELHTFGWYAAKISPYLPKKAFQPVKSRLFGGDGLFIVDHRRHPRCFSFESSSDMESPHFCYAGLQFRVIRIFRT
ncbi:hypothetical protein B4119_3726 [Parageobacillus caldoxylosilyticus]|uniref:Uncharacterized protein n=1 Tax=Saccharococcus caldoxylosilyticus TaxID=81408 RepID=A0A150M392_9BACL|nr:hypothetical protein B4119_3726 [Parageobacillus caldoxylosilyticus]